MTESYFNLKKKLEDLGYNNMLPIEAVPLVECVLADLLQTTSSLRHYMDLSKDALMQRDSLMLEAEPYKCDNTRLIQENNQLHRETMQLKEENLKLSKEFKRKVKSLSEELMKKDVTITKLQHDLRDMSLRGICADTQSSRIKSKKKEDHVPKYCICNDKKTKFEEKDFVELVNKIQALEENNDAYCDEIMYLKEQVDHRDCEINRLNVLLEGGRPFTAISRDCVNLSSDSKVKDLLCELHDMEAANNILKTDIENCLEKQHEAMLRALCLADKNKSLQDELQKVDALALKVEDDCNKRLAEMTSKLNYLQIKNEKLSKKVMELESELDQKTKENSPKNVQDMLNVALKENDALHKEINDLVDLNKSLQDKILSISQIHSFHTKDEQNNLKNGQKCPTRDELLLLLQDERMKYEKQMMMIQEKILETMTLFNKHLTKGKDQIIKPNISNESIFIRELNKKLCEAEQKILMLNKEKEELKAQIDKHEEYSKQNYKDIINQLNSENTELTKENIALSQQLSQLKNLNVNKYNDRGDYTRSDVKKYKNKIDELLHEINILQKDKQEYNLRYKEAIESQEKLKRDLITKQKELEHLEEENCSYKITNRTGKASSEHYQEECKFLREQLKKLQSDMIKDKTLFSQIQNIQLETERSSSEVQNELLSTQKKLSLSKNTIGSVERRCRDLQIENASLKNDKCNLIDNLRKVDEERDKLVIELDNKTENLSVLEQKYKSQTYEISKLETEISELKRSLNVHKISEHKLIDYEAQITFLNGEILQLKQKFDTAIMENKHLQNSLADVNGTLKITKIELEKSRKEVEGLKQQLQHYVAEIRRIEELLSQKEAERSDMLEHFASLSVEANILENTNHSLESESASKSLQLQSYINKIQSLEANITEKENIIGSQSAHIASMKCTITALENEVRLLTEEKAILQQNISYLKQMCSNLQSDNVNNCKDISNTDSELKLYESRIRNLSNAKLKLEEENNNIKDNLKTSERLLSNARKEIVELKLALQDATSETKSLQESVTQLSRKGGLSERLDNELEFPLMLEEIHEVSQEDDVTMQYSTLHRRHSKYTNSGTL